MKAIDVLWLVEHVARELDVACAVKCMASSYGIEMVIGHMHVQEKELINKYDPQVVVTPYFYRASDWAIRDYIRVWQNAIFFNLAWEQIFYKAHISIKAPADNFTKKKVYHHAWSEFYRDYLIKNGVARENIFLNGNPIYQLYQNPYIKYFPVKSWLVREYNLKNNCKWIFIPENYGWAFASDLKIEKLAKTANNLAELLRLREFCQKSLITLLIWCQKLGKFQGIEIIFRPRPAVRLQQMLDFIKNNVGLISDNLHILKDASVREWILASDIVISSYSTSLIEAALANKPIFIVEPIPIPKILYCDWYEYVPRIKSQREFTAICTNTIVGKTFLGLKKWALKEMPSRGDPIKNLAYFIQKLLQSKRNNNINNYNNKKWIDMDASLSRLKIFYEHFQDRGFVRTIRYLYEDDVVSQKDMLRRDNLWQKVIYGN